jgi:hypothetical protein
LSGAFDVLVAGGLCLAAMVLATAALKKAGVAGTPIVPQGAWRPVLWVGVLGGFVTYVGTVVLFARARLESRRVAFAIAVAIQGLPLTTRLILAGDANFYVGYGHSPHPYQSSPYGSLWIAISRLVVHTHDPIFVLRLIAFGSVLTITALVSTLSDRKTLAVVLVGWNPLFAFHFAGGGHLDAFMTLLAVGAVCLSAAGLIQAAGAAWVASVFVKLTAAPIYVLWAIGSWRRSRAGLLGALASALALSALSTWLFGWSWLDVVPNTRKVQDQQASFLWGWIKNLGISWHDELWISGTLWAIAFVVFAALAHRGRCRLGLAAGVLALVAPHIEAWYLILPLALAAGDDDDRAGKILAIVLSGILLTDVLTPVIA